MLYKYQHPHFLGSYFQTHTRERKKHLTFVFCLFHLEIFMVWNTIISLSHCGLSLNRLRNTCKCKKKQKQCIQVHERQTARMRTRSEWFLGCGGSLNSEMNLCVSTMQANTIEDDSRGNYTTNNICGHSTNDSGSLRTGICMC